MRRHLWRHCPAVLALALAACTSAPSVRPTAAKPIDLAGLELRLAPMDVATIIEDAQVDGVPARLSLEPAAPRSTASAACFAGKPAPEQRTTVRIPQPSGGHLEVPERDVPRIDLGGRRFGPLRVAVAPGERCALMLGSDVLDPYAITVAPDRRRATLTPSRPRDWYTAQLPALQAEQPHQELSLVELTRDPIGDWPLLSVRLKQGRVQLTEAFVLELSAARSTLGARVAEGAGLETDVERLRAMRLPPGFEVQLDDGAYDLDRLELQPGLGLQRARLERNARWKGGAAAGVIGGDVWGHFTVTLDAKAGVLLLRRPRVLASGALQRCEGADGRSSEEGCYALQVDRDGRGLMVIATLFRDLPEGGRLYLQPLSATGPIEDGCRLGLSFDADDRGISVAHRVPWAGLARVLPACTQAFERAERITFSLFEDGPRPDCPGRCIFADVPSSGAVSCECSQEVGTRDADVQQRLRSLLRVLKERVKAPPPPTPAVEEPEPP